MADSFQVASRQTASHLSQVPRGRRMKNIIRLTAKPTASSQAVCLSQPPAGRRMRITAQIPQAPHRKKSAA